MRNTKRIVAALGMLGSALFLAVYSGTNGTRGRAAAAPTPIIAAATTSGRQPETLKLRAPEFIGAQWLNTAPINLAERRGKVTIVEFWTFACGNCLANLPAYARWQQRFAKQDVAVIGVHTPETEQEENPANVRRRVQQLGITYPILLDRDHKNWAAWQQEYWPTVYLIDKQGVIRYRWAGELNYRNAGGEETLARLVETLLAE